MTDNVIIYLRNQDGSRYKGSINLKGRDEVPTSSDQLGMIGDPGLAEFTEVVATAWEKYLVATSPSSVTTDIDTKVRRLVSERAPYERFNDFFDITLEATDELFKLTPSKVDPEVRGRIFQNWIDKISSVYGFETSPRIGWDESPWFPFDSESTVKIHSSRPYIMNLFEAYRRTLQANGKAINIVTGGKDIADESEIENENYVPTGTCGNSECGATGQNGNYCSVCSWDLENDDHNFVEVPTPDELRQRGLDYDAHAWAESLYYQVRPKLFAKMVVSYKLPGGNVADLTPELRAIGEQARDEV